VQKVMNLGIIWRGGFSSPDHGLPRFQELCFAELVGQQGSVMKCYDLCNISGFLGGDYEECRLLGCYAVLLLRKDVSEGRIAFIINVARIGEQGTTLAVTSN
jgi:hypothetical protein